MTTLPLNIISAEYLSLTFYFEITVIPFSTLNIHVDSNSLSFLSPAIKLPNTCITNREQSALSLP